MTKRAQVYIDTDSTNVYGYVNADVIGVDGLVDREAHERLPRKIQELCREQWPSTDCRGILKAANEAATLLKRLGFEVLDADLEPYAIK